MIIECLNHFRDVSLELYKPNANYEAWWKYYVYPQNTLGYYLDGEPPPIEPYYYNHVLYATPPTIPVPMLYYPTEWVHP
jgi:hypothetical protein